MLAGGAAGFTSVACFYPLDFARTRLAMDIGRNKADRQFTNFFDCIFQIFKSDGIVGLYRGVGVSLLLTILYRGAYFGLFDTGKLYLFPDNKTHNFFLMWAFGTLTTAVPNFALYPLDTIRRRMMMQSGRKDRLYKNTLD